MDNTQTIIDKFRYAIIQGYRLEELIGKGGMSYVFLGSKMSGGEHQHKAIKLLNKSLLETDNGMEYSERFHIEMENITKLRNVENIVRVHEFGEYEGWQFIIMDYYKGGTLAKRISHPATISLKQLIEHLSDIAVAIDKIHKRNIIHRDIKPENILFDIIDHGDDKEVEQAILTDFGVSKNIKKPRKITDNDRLLGTILYMAPEVLVGAPATEKSDLYSLALIIYDFLTYEERLNWNLPKLLEWHKLPEKLSENMNIKEISVVINKALSLDQSQRYHTAVEFINKLTIANEKFNARTTMSSYNMYSFESRADAVPISVNLISDEIPIDKEAGYDEALAIHIENKISKPIEKPVIKKQTNRISTAIAISIFLLLIIGMFYFIQKTGNGKVSETPTNALPTSITEVVPTSPLEATLMTAIPQVAASAFVTEKASDEEPAVLTTQEATQDLTFTPNITRTLPPTSTPSQTNTTRPSSTATVTLTTTKTATQTASHTMTSLPTKTFTPTGTPTLTVTATYTIMPATDVVPHRNVPFDVALVGSNIYISNLITNKQYKDCLERNYLGCSLPESPYFRNPVYENEPVVGITWKNGEAFCRFWGGHIITFQNWDIAVTENIISNTGYREWLSSDELISTSNLAEILDTTLASIANGTTLENQPKPIGRGEDGLSFRCAFVQ